MTDKPQNQNQVQVPVQLSPQKHILPKIDPAKTINYRQDGVDRQKVQK